MCYFDPLGSVFSQFTVVSNLVSQTGVAISHTGRRSATYHGPSKEAWILPTGWTVAMVVDTKGKNNETAYPHTTTTPPVSWVIPLRAVCAATARTSSSSPIYYYFSTVLKARSHGTGQTVCVGYVRIA